MQHDVWSIVALAGLAGWILSALALIFSAFPGRGQFLVQPAVRWGAALAVSYAVWVMGLLNA